jgi:hypothetical protein
MFLLHACSWIGGACALLLTPLPYAVAQESSVGITMPATITGEGLYSQRLREQDPDAASAAAAFRLVLYPSLKLGSHWFVSGAFQVHSTPFFYDEAEYPNRTVDTKILQAFVGYSRSTENTSLTVKAGHLATAFGSFPLRYDDALNPLIDVPPSYGYDEKPVSLDGLPALEVNVSHHRIDTRFQLSNSSPVNPQTLRSHNQHAQWTAGAGYTTRQGLRIGVSAFRGLCALCENPLLEEEQDPGDFSATGVGSDLQWARGRWSINAEWQRFHFKAPGNSAAVGTYGYAEAKLIVTARLYAAVRVGYQKHNTLPNRQNYEAVIGYRPNRLQLLKVGYLWVCGPGIEGTGDNVLGVQYVTSIHSLSKSLH